jgi:hypothetical protein
MAKQIKHVYGSTGWSDGSGSPQTYSQSIYTVPSGRIAKLIIDYIYNGYNSDFSSQVYAVTQSRILIGPGLYDVKSSYSYYASTSIQATLWESNGASGSVYQAFQYPNQAWRRPIEHPIFLSAGQTVSTETYFASGTAYVKWNMLVVEEY